MVPNHVTLIFSLGTVLRSTQLRSFTAVQCVCNRRVVKHPIICSESGRAIVSHHSVLVFEAVGMSVGGGASSALSAHYLAEELSEDYWILFDAALCGDCEICLLYTKEMKQRCVEQFKQGAVCMEQLAAVEGLCELVRKAVGAGEADKGDLGNGDCDFASASIDDEDLSGIGNGFPIVDLELVEQDFDAFNEGEEDAIEHGGTGIGGEALSHSEEVVGG
ncbi:Arginine decarboxylase [Spatholobus suberectus]|nr:Arginine decarboxylase [Spatholobus suberectus]